MSEGQLEGRVALVTGASRGLGRAIAIRLARAGASVAVAARTEEVWDDRLPGTIGETVAAIEAAGGRAVAVRADLLEPSAPAGLIDSVHEALGPVTVLVNNAAFTAPGRPPSRNAESAAPKKPAAAPAKAPAGASRADWPALLGTPLNAYRRHFEIAVFAAYELIQLAAADMIAAGGGAIIDVTSAASRMPGGGPYPDTSGGILPGYGGSKAALEHLTQCAAYELQRWNVSVNALSPSEAIQTPGVSYYAREFDAYGSADDFAEAALRLALVDAQVVTGRTIGHFEVLDGTFRPWDEPPRAEP
jgi:NAD(P)-dependent dehydrogenase (short-subunit alcohol dehydrogenase family)